MTLNNFVISRKVITILFFGLGVVISCSKNDVKPSSTTTTTTTQEVPPAVLNTPIVDSILPSDNGTLDIFGEMTIKFHQPINHPLVSQNLTYKPVLEGVTVQGVSITISWSKDSTQITIRHKEALTPKSQFKLSVISHWEQLKNKGVWEVVSYQGSALRETKQSTFSTNEGKVSIDSTNIQYSYPISNQYHFFPKESTKGFIKLIQGQSYLFEDTGFETSVEFRSTSSSVSQNATYDVASSQLNFQIPDGLSNEKIYQVIVHRKNKTSGEVTDLLHYAFRTSKFNSFAEKVASFDLSATALRGLYAPWDVDYLKHSFSSAEYFDDFELEVKSDSVYGGVVKYSTNLIQFSAIFSGNNWFDNHINPLLYAPWTDSDFVPKITRDTTRVGYKPKRAMGIFGGVGGRLTKQMILSDNAAPIATSQSPYLIYYVVPYLKVDFMEIQSQVAKRYLSQTTVPKREDNVLWAIFPMILKGNYYYNILYKLPDGTTTSSIKLVMYNPIG
jgi:hypothetical protein